MSDDVYAAQLGRTLYETVLASSDPMDSPKPLPPIPTELRPEDIGYQITRDVLGRSMKEAMDQMQAERDAAHEALARIGRECPGLARDIAWGALPKPSIPTKALKR